MGLNTIMGNRGGWPIVNRLQAAKDPRLNDVLKSFETFLGDMLARKEGQDFGTLNWVAEVNWA